MIFPLRKKTPTDLLRSYSTMQHAFDHSSRYVAGGARLVFGKPPVLGNGTQLSERGAHFGVQKLITESSHTKQSLGSR